jgi:hypothetical protein
MDARHDVLELARFLTELSVIDYYFVIHRPSSVALAALLNAMEDVPGAAEGALESLTGEIKRIAKVDASSPDVVECRNRLRLLYSQGGYSPPEPRTETRAETISPVCVSYGCNVYPKEAEHPMTTEEQHGFASDKSTGTTSQVDGKLVNVTNTAQPASGNRLK